MRRKNVYYETIEDKSNSDDELFSDLCNGQTRVRMRKHEKKLHLWNEINDFSAIFRNTSSLKSTSEIAV